MKTSIKHLIPDRVRTAMRRASDPRHCIKFLNRRDRKALGFVRKAGQ